MELKTMNRLFLLCFAVVASLGFNFAFAGSGHVDKMPDVAIESISKDGLKQIKVTNSVLATDEIKYLDMARKHLAAKYGTQAENWLVMIDLSNQRILFSDQTENPMSEILFKDL